MKGGLMSWYPDLLHDQAGGDGGPRSQTQCVVIHATDNTASDEAEASYAETRPDHTSAHFYSDEDSVIQALDTSHVAYGCYPIGNSRSVQFEISGRSNELTDASLRRAAPVVARVCQEYGIPIRKVTPTELAGGAKGICGHLDVTRAWGEGDHTDPGAYFPWSTFIAYVQHAANPAAAAANMPEGDCDMVSGELHEGTKRTMIGLDDVNSGLAMNGPTWLSFVTDPALLAEKGVDQVRLRVAVTDGKGWNVPVVTLGTGATKPDGSKLRGWRVSMQLGDGINGIRVDRLDLASADDPAGQVEIGYCVMYGPKRA
jgi:hypothetical protein